MKRHIVLRTKYDSDKDPDACVLLDVPDEDDGGTTKLLMTNFKSTSLDTHALSRPKH